MQTRSLNVPLKNNEVLYSVADRVATITLNRPDKLNAWTVNMEGEYKAAFAEAAHDPEVRVILVTGAGRGFCAGADMSLLQSVMGGNVTRKRRGSGQTHNLRLATVRERTSRSSIRFRSRCPSQ